MPRVSTDIEAFLETASDAAARNELGLGTSAVEDVGTSAGNVVQLDGNAKLPAVDGSNLTGVAGSGDMNKSVYDPTSVEDDAFDMANMVENTDAKVLTATERTTISTALQPADVGTAAAEDVGTAIGDVVQLEDVGGSAGLPAVDGSQLTGVGTGSGDMLAATYDPTSIEGDAFDMANMVEAADAKVLTSAERSSIGAAVQPGDIGTAAAEDVGYFATAAQGSLADSAVQPADIGTAAAEDVGYFATAAQGSLADSALQPRTPTDLNGGTALTLNTDYYESFTGDRTLTISGSPSPGDTINLVFDTDGTDRAITFPSCKRVGYSDTPDAHAVTFSADNTHVIKLLYAESAWWLTDSGNTGVGLPVAEGGTGATTESGARTNLGLAIGSDVVGYDGALGTPSSGTLSGCSGLPISTGVSGLGTGVATALAVNTGSAGAPVLLDGALGTPLTGTLTNCTGLPVAGTLLAAGTGCTLSTNTLNVDASQTQITAVGTIGTGTWEATDVGVAHGGTGASTAAEAATNLGLGTGDSPQFTAVNIGHATDTTLARVSAGVASIEGVNVMLASGSTSFVELGFAVTDETTAITSGTTKLSFVMPFDMTLTSIYSSLATGPTTTAVQVDINDAGTTLLNAVIDFSTTGPETTDETTTFTGSASSYALSKGDVVTVDIDQGDTAAAGLKITFKGYRT
jgi:hypothetical protein